MINIYKDKYELAVAFCEELVHLSKSKVKFNIALSGGSTPEIIFQELSKNYKDRIDWSKIHLFWGDERCVPPDNIDSNYRMTKKHLLDNINIPIDNVHRILGENDPSIEADRYSEELRKKINLKNELPAFDIILLGMGEDGHTASIFPDQLNLINSENICEVAVHPTTSQKRITLTGKVINNSEMIIFLVTGQNKSEVLKKVIVDKDKTLPATFIGHYAGGLKFFIDEAAASYIKNFQT